MRLPKPTRRQVLTIGSLVTGGTLVGGFLWLPSAAPGKHVLSADELSIIGALGEVFFPEGNAIGLSWRDVELESGVDQLLSETIAPNLVDPFRYLLRFVEYGTIAETGSRFTRCSVKRRAALLEDWGRPGSKYRSGGMNSLKSILGMAYFNHPRVLDAVGWRSMCSVPVREG